jgi:hypothetical protein
MIKTNNKLIAEFMGWKTHPKYGKNYLQNNDKNRILPPYYTNINNNGSLSDFIYNISWDWLIPVIDKIKSKDCYVEYLNNTSNMISDGGIYINTKFIKNTYNDVIDFIKWYNKNV